MAKILITDDTGFIRTMLKIVLTAGGHEVIEAADGRQAVAMYSLHQPDVVLMDITMSEMNGIDAVKSIIEKDPEAKIIMCSALGTKDWVISAVQAGAKSFILKPFDIDTVLNEVSKLI